MKSLVRTVEKESIDGRSVVTTENALIVEIDIVAEEIAVTAIVADALQVPVIDVEADPVKTRVSR